MIQFGYDENSKTVSAGDIILWKRILTYSGRYAVLLGCAVILSLLITCATLYMPRLIQQAIDGFITNTTLARDARIAGLMGLSVQFFICIIIICAATFIQVVLLEWVAQSIMHIVRQDLFKHLLTLDLPFFDTTPTGRLVTRLTNDIQNMHEMFTSVLVTILNDILRIIGVFIILLLINVRLALIMMVFIPAAALMIHFFAKLARVKFREIRTQLAKLNSFLAETVSGIATIQLFGKQKQIVASYAALSKGYLQKTLAQIKLFAMFMPLTELLNSTAIAIILWYGGKEIIADHLSLGELVAFLSYMRLFFQPLRELAQKFSIVQSAMASAERIFELLDTKATITAPQVTTPIANIDGKIQFDKVVFGYKQDTPLLHDLTFTIQPGETIALVGATGSGKTTLVNLLLRFYDPQSGTISIDNRNIATLDITTLRNIIGVVLQDILIINDTLYNNIALDTGVSKAEVEKIVHETGMAPFIDKLPKRLDTVLGEGGKQLSTGEKQILSFARVLCRKPSILILDEATAAIDSESENILEEAITRSFAGKTSIIVAHRLSTIHRADRIIVMDKGRFVEMGTHEQLMDKQKLYAELVAMDLSHQDKEYKL